MNKKTRFLAQAGMIAALYVVVTHLQNFVWPESTSFAIQFRLSEALCVLSVSRMVWRHKANLLRLKNGTESKFYFGQKEEAASGDETMAEAECSGKMEREHIA